MAAPGAGFNAPEAYDTQLAPVTFGPFAEVLADRTPASGPGPVLEIACGTGVLTRALRRRLAPDVQLVATDLSPAMLAYARTHPPDQPGITWSEADAQRLPFPDGQFRAVACAFGFMFAADRLVALREARRVLAPGGLLLFSVWDRIEDNPHGLAGAEVIEALFPGDPQLKFRVPYEMHDETGLHGLLAAAGFVDATVETVRLPITGVDPQSLANGQIRGTPRSALLVERGVSLEQVVADVAAALVRQGGKPYAGYAQAKLVQARAG
jgi:SAM-dependent methyltransferase